MRRYEGQMQSQRLRMVSDNELRLEQFQAERKDEKRRYEDALDRLKQVHTYQTMQALLKPSFSVSIQFQFSFMALSAVFVCRSCMPNVFSLGTVGFSMFSIAIQLSKNSGAQHTTCSVACQGR